MIKKKVVLGIDTSNYTSSVCIVDTDANVLKNAKLPLPVKEGEVGLRQSDAVFFHTKNIPSLFKSIRKELSEVEIVAVGVSDRPRDADGSYMPCFLSGVAVAEALSDTHGTELYSNSHQSGHIAAAMYSSGMGLQCDGEFISFHVSGGTTEMLLCNKKGGAVSARIIGKTLDLNAGQVIDRCGVMLGLRFPCGAELEKYALSYYGDHEQIGGFGVSVKDLDCCLSGTENLARKAFSETEDAGYTAAFVLEYIAKTLIKVTDAACKIYGELPLLYAGGVMSNGIIKDRITKKYPRAFFASPEFSSDNAAGTALLTLEKHLGCEISR